MASADPAFALQTGVSAALKGSADVLAVFRTYSDGVIRVYDRVPADALTGKITAPFPYLTIGEDHIIGQTNQNTDPSECMVKVDCWSRPTTGSKLEVKALAGAVRSALCQDFALNGFGVVAFEHHDTMYRREPDGLTERAIVQIRLIVTPTWKPTY